MLQIGNAQIDLTPIVLAVITLIFGLISRYAIPYAKSKLNGNQIEMLRIAVKTAVYAAEQIYNTSKKVDPDGTVRKKFVKEAIKRVAYETKTALTDREIVEIMEAAVQELNFVTHQEKMLIGE